MSRERDPLCIHFHTDVPARSIVMNEDNTTSQPAAYSQTRVCPMQYAVIITCVTPTLTTIVCALWYTRSIIPRSDIRVGLGSDEECSEVHNSPWTVSICILHLFKLLSCHRCPWMLVYVVANSLAICSVVWTPRLLFNACQSSTFAHNCVAWRVWNSCSYFYIVTVSKYPGLWCTRRMWTCCRAVVCVVANPLCAWVRCAMYYLHETVLVHPLNLSISLSGGRRTK